MLSQNIDLPFFTNILLLLLIAKVLGETFERFKQPAMIGEILAGIILGPSILGLITKTPDLDALSKLGVFLLVIIAGLEIEIEDLVKNLSGKNLLISISAFFIPIFLGWSVAIYFELDVMSAIFVGLCVAITALPVSIRILMDLNLINTSIGKKIISVAVFDDVLALTILGILLNFKNGNTISIESFSSIALTSLLKISLLIFVIIGAQYFIKILTQKENFIENQLDTFLSILKGKESLSTLLFVFILVFATFTESLHLHFIIGAFFASVLMSKSLIGEKHLHSFHKVINGMAMGFLAPIFFACIGLEFHFNEIQNYLFLASIIFISFFSKIIAGFLGGKLTGMNNKESVMLGIGLNARGIMELVIANIAFNEGLINSEIFSILVVMGIVTTISTPFLMRYGKKGLE